MKIIDLSVFNEHKLLTGKKNGEAFCRVLKTDNYKFRSNKSNILIKGSNDQVITSSFLVGLLNSSLRSNPLESFFIEGFQSEFDRFQVEDELKRAWFRSRDYF